MTKYKRVCKSEAVGSVVIIMPSQYDKSLLQINQALRLLVAGKSGTGKSQFIFSLMLRMARICPIFHVASLVHLLLQC